MSKPLQQYIVRKYIMASSATDAIRKDKKTPVQDVWINEKQPTDKKVDCIGFVEDQENDYE